MINKKINKIIIIITIITNLIFDTGPHAASDLVALETLVILHLVHLCRELPQCLSVHVVVEVRGRLDGGGGVGGRLDGGGGVGRRLDGGGGVGGRLDGGGGGARGG